MTALAPIILSVAPSPASADGGDFWGSPSGARLRAVMMDVRIAVHPRDARGELCNGSLGGPEWHPWLAINAWPVALPDPRALSWRAYRGSRAKRVTHAAIADRHVLILGRHAAQLVLRIPESAPWGELRVAQTLTGAPVIAMVVPNPSPRSREWNNPDAVPRMVRWVRAFYDDFRAARGT